MVTRGKLPPPRKKAEGVYRHGDLRNALLDAASELVVARSGPDFSLREIAARVGVRHTAVYRHFASKEALLSALATRAFERMAKRFKAVEDRHGADIDARIRELAEAYLAMAHEEPGAYRVMFANLSEPDPNCETAAKACFDALVSASTEGQRRGLMRDDLPAIAIAASNWAALHGFSMLLLDKRLDENVSGGDAEMLSSVLRKVLREGWLAG